VTITLDGSQRYVQLASEHFDSVRLAYAQHVWLSSSFGGEVAV